MAPRQRTPLLKGQIFCHLLSHLLAPMVSVIDIVDTVIIKSILCFFSVYIIMFSLECCCNHNVIMCMCCDYKECILYSIDKHVLIL